MEKFKIFYKQTSGRYADVERFIEVEDDSVSAVKRVAKKFFSECNEYELVRIEIVL